MCSKPEEDVTQTLHTIFHEGLDLYNKVSNSNEPTNSPQIQRDVQKGIALLEQATRLVSLADIFSKNEELDELATNDIQYLLLPALLGFLTAKLTSRERKEVVEIAEVYFKDFLQRTNGYKLSNYHFNKPEETVDNSKKTDFELLSMAVNTRANKIQKYREHKELKEHLNNLKTNVENEHADEDIKRKYFLTMLRVFIHDVVDELESINMEKPILEHMATVKREDAPKPKRPPPPPLKLIIITKDAAQKAVYGAGYPSLPTMTVDEFYEKRVAEGAFPDPNKPREAKGGAMSLQEASLAGISLNDQQDQEEEETENKEERDDEELIARMRARDEYRDEHRRGWGNRMNRS